ncbi:MAG: sigma-54-dependent Fis family transcriptional regulator [Deltaproteobacteria bacterium]|nr:sigma-54-dependent Fis family transcriptional regulator [Deltaproteobacteria bacterium]
MASILIIDDDRLICESISNVVTRLGHEATFAFTLQQGLDAVMSGKYDVVFLDVRMPDGNGLDILPKVHSAPYLPEVIIITGFGDPEGAELAIKHGAWDYLQKPCSVEGITLPLVRALQYREEKKARRMPLSLKREGIIGNSLKMKECLEHLGQVANSEANVLITGETGTGKELFALAIHQNSLRANKNFVVVDCAALPEKLVESILFGHEKGAYTSADRAQDGLMLQADGGTLFLDEVGELPLSIQKNFLRAIQERSFRPVGGKREVNSNFRLISASNRNLDEMVGQNQFREDLLFRLRSFTIELPPLRDRLEDIQPLVLYYIPILCDRYRIEPKEFSPDFFDILTGYHWPGNVRELINALEKALITARYDRILFPRHLPTHIRVHIVRSSLREQGTTAVGRSDSLKLFPKLQDLREKAIAETEKKYLQDVILFTKGDIPEACRISGLSRSRLYLLLKKHHISTAI